jgi:hypothetical protein
MNSRLVVFTGLAALAVTAIAVFVLTSRGREQSGEGEEAVTEFAPVRAYAGLFLETQDTQDGTVVFVQRVGPGSPAEQAGMRMEDVVRRAGSKTVTTGEDVYAEIEERRPGNSIEIEVDRYHPPFPPGRLPDPERITLKLDLVAEPPPGTDYAQYVWVPWTGIRQEDQLRLGAYLADITQPLAEHHGITTPGGALVHGPLPFTGFELGFAEGDVIVSFDGSKVNSLSQLQKLVDQAPEDKSIEIGVRRGGQELNFTLSALGPSVRRANHLPPQARFRLQAALERGDLHPQHVQTVANSYRRRDPTPGESAHRAGSISRLSDSSITIELYETGSVWTLAIDSSTIVAGFGARALSDLNLGEFVDLLSRGETATHIYSKQAPLPPR